MAYQITFTPWTSDHQTSTGDSQGYTLTYDYDALEARPQSSCGFDKCIDYSIYSW
jgi:hypothetical protein